MIRQDIHPAPGSKPALVTTAPARYPIEGLAASRAAGVEHDHLAEIMTRTVRGLYSGKVPAWWALSLTQPVEPGRPWPLETILVDDALQEPLGNVATAFTRLVASHLPWKHLSVVLSAPAVFSYICSPRFKTVEAVPAGFNVMVPNRFSPNDLRSTGTFVGKRFDPTMTLDQRIEAALDDVEEYLKRRELTLSASRWRGRRTTARLEWVNICGYLEGLNLLELNVMARGGRRIDEADRPVVHAAVYDRMHAYNAPSVEWPDFGLDYSVQVNL